VSDPAATGPTFEIPIGPGSTSALRVEPGTILAVCSASAGDLGALLATATAHVERQRDARPRRRARPAPTRSTAPPASSISAASPASSLAAESPASPISAVSSAPSVSSPSSVSSASSAPVTARLAVISARSAVASGFDLIENVFLGRVPLRRIGPIPIGIDTRRMRVEAARVLADVGLDLHLETRGDHLDELARLRLELARALVAGADAIVLDEPTALLDASAVSPGAGNRPAGTDGGDSVGNDRDDDAARLLALLGRLRDRGLAVVVLTQRPRQALTYADSVAVLAGRREVARHEVPPGASTAGVEALRDAILRDMFAHPNRAAAPTVPDVTGLSAAAAASAAVTGAAAPAVPGAAAPAVPADALASGSVIAAAASAIPTGTAASGARATTPAARGELLRVRGWSVHDVLRPERLVVDDVSFEVGAGEIVGVAGLRRSGAEDLLLSIYGRSAGTDATGEVSVRGTTAKTDTVEHAIAAGLFFVGTPHQRYRMQLLGGFAVPVSQSRVRGLASFGLLSDVSEVPPDAERGTGAKLLGAVRSLSREGDEGARVLGLLEAFPASERQVLFLLEPFDGATPAERESMLAALRAAVAGGKGAVLVSTDTAFLLEHCDRTVTLSDGRLTGALPRGTSLEAAGPLLAPH
jgi:ABC-type sugar transport system ATPase subunit